MRRLRGGGPKFAALTFDDGYRDTRDHALPILERHGAPATLFFAPGLIEGTARLWWLELEEAIRRLDVIEAPPLPARTPAEKAIAVRARLLGVARPPRGRIARRGRGAGGEGRRAARMDEFLDWDETRALSRHPLIEIGGHSLTHRRLAQWPEALAREELAGCKSELEARLGVEIESFAYPVGDPTSAGAREFRLAREAGYRIAVTTRPGMLFQEHAAHPHALPRVSLNGLWQNLDYLDVLLTGAPFRLWNRGRRLNVA